MKQVQHFRKMRVELVEWVDSSSITSWNAKDSYDRMAGGDSLLCRSVGFVFQESKDRLSLVLSESIFSFNHAITIPKVAIKSRKVIRLT